MRLWSLVAILFIVTLVEVNATKYNNGSNYNKVESHRSKRFISDHRYEMTPSKRAWICHPGCKNFCLPSCKSSCCTPGANDYHPGMIPAIESYQRGIVDQSKKQMIHPYSEPQPYACGQFCSPSCAPSCTQECCSGLTAPQPPPLPAPPAPPPPPPLMAPQTPAYDPSTLYNPQTLQHADWPPPPPPPPAVPVATQYTSPYESLMSSQMPCGDSCSVSCAPECTEECCQSIHYYRPSKKPAPPPRQPKKVFQPQNYKAAKVKAKQPLRKLNLLIKTSSPKGAHCQSSCEKLCLPACDFVCCIPVRLRKKAVKKPQGNRKINSQPYSAAAQRPPSPPPPPPPPSPPAPPPRPRPPIMPPSQPRIAQQMTKQGLGSDMTSQQSFPMMGICTGSCPNSCYPSCSNQCCETVANTQLGETLKEQFPKTCPLGCSSACAPSCTPQCCFPGVMNSPPLPPMTHPVQMQQPAEVSTQMSPKYPENMCAPIAGCSETCAPTCSKACCYASHNQEANHYSAFGPPSQPLSSPVTSFPLPVPAVQQVVPPASISYSAPPPPPPILPPPPPPSPPPPPLQVLPAISPPPPLQIQVQVPPPPACPPPCSPACSPACSSDCCLGKGNKYPLPHLPMRPQPPAPPPNLSPSAIASPSSSCPSSCMSSCSPSCPQGCCASSPMMPQTSLSMPASASSIATQTLPQPPMIMPALGCPGSCPQSCAPACTETCCKEDPSQHMLCPSSCLSTCAPTCAANCCQSKATLPGINSVQTLPSSPSPGGVCHSGCSDYCAPLCSQECCDSAAEIDAMEKEMSDDDCNNNKCAEKKGNFENKEDKNWDKRKEITPITDDKRSYIPRPRPRFMVRQKLENINLG